VLAAEHKHFDIERLGVTLTVPIAEATFEFELRAKTISNAGRFLRAKAEHDDLSTICAALREHGHEVPLAMLKAAIEIELTDPKKRARVSARF
jgi:hypothetical protein